MKIFAVGMNYLQHSKELLRLTPLPRTEGEEVPQEPIIFTKADSALLKNGKPFFIPDWSARIDYEAELVVRICRLGKGIPERFAHRYYDAFTVGIDFTARDLQQQARRQGNPWTICKGFDGSAAIGRWVDKADLPPLSEITFRLDINGRTVQQGCAADMLFSVDQIISYLSRFFTLKTGDLLFTGTPVGVGPVAINDHLQGFLNNQPVLDFHCR